MVNINPGTFTTAIGPIGVLLKSKGSPSHDDDWMIWGYPHDLGNLQKQKDPTIEQNTEKIRNVRGFTAFLVIYLPPKIEISPVTMPTGATQKLDMTNKNEINSRNNSG